MKYFKFKLLINFLSSSRKLVGKDGKFANDAGNCFSGDFSSGREEDYSLHQVIVYVFRIIVYFETF